MTTKGPLYLKIHLDLLHKIESGEWPEDTLIPTEKQLQDYYQVSRGTIRKAVDLLVQEKYLVRKAGFGTVVYQNKNSKIHFTLIQSLTNEMNEMGIKLNTLDIELDVVEADLNLATIFEINEGEKLYNLRRVRGIGFPILYSTTFLRPTFKLPKNISPFRESLYRYLADNNITFTRFKESVSVMLCPDSLSKKLKVEINTPLLKRIRKSYDFEGTLMEYSTTYYIGAYYEYRSEISYR